MNSIRSLAQLSIVLFLGLTSQAAPITWNLEQLSVPPKTYPAEGFESNNIQAVYFDGLPWKGKPTRVFAYIGIPKIKPGQKVPGMVLIHGGEGTAFSRWVKLWNSRGYAAIAMDTCGSTPSPGGRGAPPRHEHGGPSGWGGFNQLDDPIEDQWTYHAVGSVILANSLLRSLPEVDANRIGLTGVSWGGMLACVTAGVDDRFRFVVPVYGSGFKTFKSPKWHELWEPGLYLPQARMPFLWVDGASDFFYPLDSVQKSYRATPAPRTLCTRINMAHSHSAGQTPPEIHAFADSILKDGTPLPRITKQGADWLEYESATRIIRAEINFTLDSGEWRKRKWQTNSATLDAEKHRVTAVIPEGAKVYFLSIMDDRGLVVSSEHITP